MGNLKASAPIPDYLFPVVETLVGVTSEGLAPTKLATGWKIAEDGSSITFELRKGVKFHDGTDFNAEAVKWNVDVIRDQSAELKVITSIDVVDEYTVRFNLSEYSNSLLVHMSWKNGMMISPASVEGRSDEYVATHLIGTGPFVLEEFQVDTKAVFKKFADYWDEGKPYLDGMEYLVAADQNTARTAFLSGEAQMWDYLDARNAPDLKAAGHKVNTCPGLARVMQPDSVNPDSPLAKKKVRWALEHAIDKRAIADAFGYGTWSATVGPCASIHLGCPVAEENARNFDPKKAKELLAEAGYPDGFKMTIYSVRSIDDELLIAIQAYLANVGIDAEVQKPDSATLSSLRREGWQNGVLLQGLTTDSPSYVTALQIDGPHKLNASSTLVPAEYKDRLAKVAAARDAATEKKLSEELVRYVQEEAIFIPVVVESRNCAYHSQVHTDLEAYSIHFWNPADTWIEQ